VFLVPHRATSHNGEQGCQPLLAIHHEETRQLFLLVCPDLSRTGGLPVAPEKQMPSWVSSVQGIEKISDLSFLPDEWPLNVRERNLPAINI
jgi:hypothetical protein